MTTKNKQGRPTKPPELIKKSYGVYLNDNEAAELIRRYGSLTLALRSVLISDKPDLKPQLTLLIEQAMSNNKKTTKVINDLRLLVR